MIGDLAVGQFRGLDAMAEVLEEVRLGVEKVIPRGSRAGVDHPHVLPLLAEQARHADLRAEGVAIRPDVRRHQEAVVGLDQVGQRRPVDRHVDSCARDRREHLSELSA